jgi:hypothetical protein
VISFTAVLENILLANLSGARVLGCGSMEIHARTAFFVEPFKSGNANPRSA